MSGFVTPTPVPQTVWTTPDAPWLNVVCVLMCVVVPLVALASYWPRTGTIVRITAGSSAAACLLGMSWLALNLKREVVSGEE